MLLAGAMAMLAGSAALAAPAPASRAVEALRRYCLPAPPGFPLSDVAMKRDGWRLFPNLATRQLIGPMHPLWESGDDSFMLGTNVMLERIPRQHTTCFVVSSSIPLRDLSFTARTTFGRLESDEVAQVRWSVPGQPRRFIMLVQGLAGPNNSGLVVVEEPAVKPR